MKKEYNSPELEISLFDFSSVVCNNLNNSIVGWEEEDDLGNDSGNDA